MASYQGGLGQIDSGLGFFGLGAIPSAGTSVRFGLSLGARVTLAPINTLAVRFGIGLGARPTVEQTHDVQARFGLGLGVRVPGMSVGPNLVAVRFGIDLGARITARQTHDLQARFGIGLGQRFTVAQTHELAARFGLALGMDIPSIGPGSGLVTATDLQDWLNSLREGDTFPCTLPYAGIAGRSGVARVLQRMVDAQGVLTFKLQFIPTTDAPAAASEARSGPPRFVPPLRQDVGRRLSNAEQRIIDLIAKG